MALWRYYANSSSSPDMSTSLSDTASFLSIMKARSMVMPKLSTAPLESLSIKAECRDHLVEKPVSAELPFASFPVTPHMKAHYRDQPLSERMTPKPYHDQPLAERMTPKTPTPSRAVPLAQTSASSKSMGPAPTSQTTSKTTAKAPIERTGSSIHVKDLKWKISADEFPRKKGAVSPVSTTMKNKVLPVVKLPPVMQTELKRSSSAQKRVIRKRVSTQNILDEGPTMTETCTQTGAVSSIIPSEDLINFEVPTPPRNTAFASPSAVVLQGLDFTIPVVPFASSPSSIYVSADAESQRGGLGFSDVISTQNEDPGVEFFDIIGNTMSKGMGTLFKDAVKQAYAKGYGIPVMRSGQSEDPSIAQSLATRSTQEPLRSVSTATRDMSHLEQWLQKANNAMEGSSFEKHRSPHGSSPGSASLNPSTCMPVPGLSPQKSEYSEIDTKPIEFMRRLDTIKPIDFTKSVEVPSPPQNQISVASRSSKPSVKYAGLLDSKYASGPPVSFTKFTKKKAPGSNAKTVPHDMASRMVSRPEFAPFRPQTAPARPPGLAAPARPPGLPVRSQAIIPHLQTSTRVLSESTSNVHKPVGSTGVRTIGPAPSVFEPTTLRGSNETAASLAFVRQPAARMPLQAENWSANIAPAISDFDALRRVSNLTFPSSSPSQVIGPNSGLTLPGFSPNPLTKPGDKAVRKVSTLGPAPFTPRK
jgi:hypothetical protein